MSNQLPETNKILEMDKEHLREIDGVVMDLDSYARHIAVTPPETPPQTSIPQPTASEQPRPPATQTVNPPPSAPENSTAASPPENHAPAPVFAMDPVHIGWYEPATPEKVSYPVMAGAIAPTEPCQQQMVTYFSGSGSGSYLSSYTASFQTSFLTSWMTSYLLGSGSWVTSFLYGSGSAIYGFGSNGILPGGFGLELI